MKQILLVAAALALGACASPTAPAHHAPAVQAPAHDVVCWDASRSGYVVYSGDKCPAE